jgi:hypothetical protein
MSGWKDMPSARHSVGLVSRTDLWEYLMGKLIVDSHAGWKVTYMIVNPTQLKLIRVHYGTGQHPSIGTFDGRVLVTLKLPA